MKTNRPSRCQGQCHLFAAGRGSSLSSILVCRTTNILHTAFAAQLHGVGEAIEVEDQKSANSRYKSPIVYR